MFAVAACPLGHLWQPGSPAGAGSFIGEQVVRASSFSNGDLPGTVSFPLEGRYVSWSHCRTADAYRTSAMRRICDSYFHITPW